MHKGYQSKPRFDSLCLLGPIPAFYLKSEQDLP